MMTFAVARAGDTGVGAALVNVPGSGAPLAGTRLNVLFEAAAGGGAAGGDGTRLKLLLDGGAGTRLNELFDGGGAAGGEGTRLNELFDGGGAGFGASEALGDAADGTRLNVDFGGGGLSEWLEDGVTRRNIEDDAGFVPAASITHKKVSTSLVRMRMSGDSKGQRIASSLLEIVK